MIKTCKKCGKEFSATKSDEWKIYCSKECAPYASLSDNFQDSEESLKKLEKNSTEFF